MKKTIILVILCLSLFACRQEESLSQPENLRYEEETILWDSVDGATSYSVKLNDVIYTVTQTQFDMHDHSNGDYTVSVCAINNDLQSDYTDTFSFSVNRLFEYPTSISINERLMTWQAIEGAISYIISIDDVEYPVTDTMFDLSFLLENKTYNLYVKAIFELGESDFSSVIEYLTYFDTVSTYQGVYNINIPYNLIIYMNEFYVINHVFYTEFLDKEDFIIQEDVLSINYKLLETFAVGNHLIQLYTPDGIVEISVEITENTIPVIISSNSIFYVANEDIKLLFEVFDGSFEAVTGHNIEESDYDFTDGILRIYSTYLDSEIATFTGDTIIFSYQLKDNDHIILGYIFIKIQ